MENIFTIKDENIFLTGKNKIYQIKDLQDFFSKTEDFKFFQWEFLNYKDLSVSFSNSESKFARDILKIIEVLGDDNLLRWFYGEDDIVFFETTNKEAYLRNKELFDAFFKDYGDDCYFFVVEEYTSYFEGALRACLPLSKEINVSLGDKNLSPMTKQKEKTVIASCRLAEEFFTETKVNFTNFCPKPYIYERGVRHV